ncbi:MAG: type I-U CRISPR-associated protein Csb2 [Thermaerobacter sp.]|nr:type I-U CRISPR-associated protein Csb2 [Thermaerobacter sp.]
MTLALEVEYLTGIAYASAGLGSDAPDWPPQPDRIFSALVAAWAARGQSQNEASALEWLERLPPPLLLASDFSPRTSHVSFVPPNDPSSTKGKHAAEVFPGMRRRQPRSFPAACPEDPVVHLFWPDTDVDDATFSALDALAVDTAYVGHSASLTRCKFRRSDACTPPKACRNAVRAVYPGRFAELQAAFKAGRRPNPGAVIAPVPRSPIEAPGTIFSTDWLLLEHVDGEMPDLRAAAMVAKAIRDKLVSAYEEIGLRGQVPETVSGLTSEGTPLRAPHLAIVPLSFTGFPHSDGRVLGFGLVPPRGNWILKDANFLSAFRHLAPLDSEVGRRILRIDGAERGGPGFTIGLAPTSDPSLSSLNPTLYITLNGHPTRTFATVTPIVLDRHLKEHGAEREAEIAKQIGDACRNIGLPEPETIEISGGGRLAAFPDKHSAIEGAPPAEPSGKSPRWLRWRLPPSLSGRALTHAVVRFAEPVQGPVILGAGRYLGLGLCRPIRDPEGVA